MSDGPAVHSAPLDDVIEHDTESLTCICGPTVQPIADSNWRVVLFVTHSRLADRERPGRNAFLKEEQ
jgi:hypothetical protein